MIRTGAASLSRPFRNTGRDLRQAQAISFREPQGRHSHSSLNNETMPYCILDNQEHFQMMTATQQIRCIFGAACRWGEHQWNHQVFRGAGNRLTNVTVYVRVQDTNYR